MLLMNFPIATMNTSVVSDTVVLSCFFPKRCVEIGQSLGSMAGNAMHLRAVGAAIGCALKVRALLPESMALAGSGYEEVCAVLPPRQLFAASPGSYPLIRTCCEAGSSYFFICRMDSMSLPGSVFD